MWRRALFYVCFHGNRNSQIASILDQKNYVEELNRQLKWDICFLLETDLCAGFLHRIPGGGSSSQISRNGSPVFKMLCMLYLNSGCLRQAAVLLYFYLTFCLTSVGCLMLADEGWLHIEMDPLFSQFRFEPVWLFQKCNSVPSVPTDSLKHRLSVTFPLSVLVFSN